MFAESAFDLKPDDIAASTVRPGAWTSSGRPKQPAPARNWMAE
jgi:hypothetical protein